jgi:acyl-coenzyme A synthetase/AMP-(fatty) acid ligase
MVGMTMTATPIDTSPGCVDLLVDRHVRSGHGEREALVEHGQHGRRALTYRQLQAVSVSLAHDLSISLAGSRTQRRIALIGGATLETICHWLAAMRSGHLVLLVHPDLTSEQYDTLWECFDPDLILHDRLAGNPVGQPCQDIGSLSTTLPAGALDVTEVSALAGSFDQRPALVLATSGSTGRPKLCVHAHRSFWEFERTVSRKLWGLTAEDRVLGSGGPYFSFGLQAVHAPLGVGATAVLLPEWTQHTDFLDTIETESVSVFLGVPTLYHLLMSRARHGYALASLSLSLAAGERLPGVIRDRWESYSGSKMLDSIGTTETFAPYLSEVRHGGPGMVRVAGFEYTEMALGLGAANEEGTALTIGLSNGCMMLGYLLGGNNGIVPPDAPFLTNDVFVRNDAAYRFQSRASERVKVAGQWVFPQQLEEWLLADRRVERAAALPITTPEGLIRLRAFVVLNNAGESADTVVISLMQRIQRELKPKALRPDRIEVVEHIPSTPTGKLQRRDLQEQVQPVQAKSVLAGACLLHGA